MRDAAVLFGGPSPEHDVSILTGLQAVRALRAAGRGVQAIYWSKTGSFHLVDAGLEATAFVDGIPAGSSPLTLEAGVGFVAQGGRLRGTKSLEIDCVVLCTHGGPGEDGSLQGALDVAGVAYTGPSVAGAALGMDKLAFSDVVRAAGCRALPRLALTSDLEALDFAGPYIVKPRFGGSSIGIDVVADLETAKARLNTNPHLRAGAVIEPYREDLDDLQVGVRRHPTVTLSAIERPLKAASASGDILNYTDKYGGGEGMASAPRELPARVAPAVGEAITAMARIVAQAALVRGVARIDFLANADEVYVNEINTIPGSLARYLFIEPAIPFAQLLADMIDEARTVPTRRYSAEGADGLVLRGATSIAAKLA